MVDREEAHRIAEKEIIARGLGTGVQQVCTVDEITWRRPAIYGGPELSTCWVAYAERPIRGLFSSDVVLISRVSGEVLYSGSAHDEG
jgi:hypothetical protein